MSSDSYLEYLIECYEKSGEVTIDDFLADILKNDPYFEALRLEEAIELKRQFFGYLRTLEFGSMDEYGEALLSDLETSPAPERLGAVRERLTKWSHRKRYVQAFISNISVPKTLEELIGHYLNGNDAQILFSETVNGGWTNWTVPRWAKRGDIVLYMHAKTAKSCLTAIRTRLRKEYPPNSQMAGQCEAAIAQQLNFHKQLGGKIYAVGRINGRPKEEKIPSNMHFKSRVFCDIDKLFLLERPIDIEEFNSFIKINRLSGITPVFGGVYERLKELIIRNNTVPDYFGYSFSTPFPHNQVNRYNWMQLGLEYRASFILESQFRQCYVDYLLSELGDQKTIYMECYCHKGTKPVTFVDNVIRIGKKLLPVEVKLNIMLENNLAGQCEQYCKLDKLELDHDKNRIARMEDVIRDKVLVIDTYAMYMFHLSSRSIEFMYDLGNMKNKEDIKELRQLVLEKTHI